MINQFARYQKGLNTLQIFPNRNDGKCACGCGKGMREGRKRWFSDECKDYAVTITLIVKGDQRVIRDQLFYRDKGVCASCGSQTENWDADHKLPVKDGGGGCLLDNFQTLCQKCHKKKTENQRLSHRATISSAADSISFQRLL